MGYVCPQRAGWNGTTEKSAPDDTGSWILKKIYGIARPRKRRWTSSMLQDTLTPKAVRESGLFRQKAIDGLVADHLEERANLGYHLWGLTILFLWMKQWNIQTAEAMGIVEKEESLELSPA